MSNWALVLAAGEGSRLRALTTTNGVAVPKQFCSLQGGPSLLQEALHRAEAVAPRTRICTIVAEQHRRWWQGPLWALPSQNIIVQPENRGTAAGLLLPLLHIEARDLESPRPGSTRRRAALGSLRSRRSDAVPRAA
jgi:mannose-1-phosphate guanylyltransferase